jgi:hypothetical protein
MLAKVVARWGGIEFVVVPYKESKDVFILGAIDDIQVRGCFLAEWCVCLRVCMCAHVCVCMSVDGSKGWAIIRARTCARTCNLVWRDLVWVQLPASFDSVCSRFA